MRWPVTRLLLVPCDAQGAQVRFDPGALLPIGVPQGCIEIAPEFRYLSVEVFLLGPSAWIDVRLSWVSDWSYWTRRAVTD